MYSIGTLNENYFLLRMHLKYKMASNVKIVVVKLDTLAQFGDV